ncbi:MAG: hypothetical protein IAE87_20130 [Rhodobacteraceae bacterium]|jgi:hypothetical protein|nr:hypothetical protein [Paracoccaceae bacterium]
MPRTSDLLSFYGLMDELAARTGGRRQLAECSGRMIWPERGIYFFFEPGEMHGRQPRVVRVGTHALTATSSTTLWKRLSQHRGTISPVGGNHRGSIFRLLVGEALMRRDPDLAVQSWDAERPSNGAERVAEKQHEARVSGYLGQTRILCLPINDPPGAGSLRGVIERNSIALLSNYLTPSGIEPSQGWLGQYSGREKVRKSGLWNNRHVDETHDPAFLAVFERLIERIPAP